MAVVQHAYAGADVNVGVSGNLIYYCDAGGPPTSGPYDVGDLALCMPIYGGVAPTALHPLGWRCTVAGSPGTWVALGVAVSAGTAVASATSITPTGRVFHVTGTTQTTTIVATNIQAGQQIIVIPDGSWTTATGGNIALGTTAVANKAITFTYDGSNWSPSY